MKYNYRILKTNTDIIPVRFSTLEKADDFIKYITFEGFWPLKNNSLFSYRGVTAKLLNEPAICERKYPSKFVTHLKYD